MSPTEPSRIWKLIELMVHALGMCRRQALGSLPLPPQRQNEGRLA